jgi:hypothetical protein
MQQGKSKTGDYFFQNNMWKHVVENFLNVRCKTMLLVALEKFNKTVFKIANHSA